MRTRLPLALILIITSAVLSTSALAATARLSGPSTMSVLQQITFKATGLRDGRYALFIDKPVQRNGHAYRCVAFLSGERPVSGGTDLFHGSVPDGVACRSAGATVDFESSLPLGRYRLHVCRPTPAAYCSSTASQVAKTVTIRR
jgi:hypothetical protein